jgi:hypothetical protein
MKTPSQKSTTDTGKGCLPLLKTSVRINLLPKRLFRIFLLGSGIED